MIIHIDLRGPDNRSIRQKKHIKHVIKQKMNMKIIKTKNMIILVVETLQVVRGGRKDIHRVASSPY